MIEPNARERLVPRAPRRHTLSVCIICKNEADRIVKCLDSVSGWADEIVVLDSGSTDGTAEIARRYTEQVWVTDWPGYGAQRNRALDRARGEWVFCIDADEWTTPELRADIDQLLAGEVVPYTVVKMPWGTHLFGQRLRFGRYTSPQAKLFIREGTRYREHKVHESLLMPRRVEGLVKGRLDHESWRDYKHLMEKHLQYAVLLAEQKHAAGKRSSLAYASLRFFTDFIQQYVFRLCFLDGWRGFLISVALGLYAFHKYAALATFSSRIEQSSGTAAVRNQE